MSVTGNVVGTVRPGLALITSRRLLVVVVFLLFVASGSIAGVAHPDDGAAPVPAVDLYVTDGPEGRRLTPLDPDTLADRRDVEAIDVDTPVSGWNATISADGSTMVTIECGGAFDCLSAGENEIVVRDPRTGAERVRYPTPEPVAEPRLSRDGSRLVVQRGAGVASAWYAFETWEGRLLATVESAESWDEAVIDGEARRLYRLVEPFLTSPPAGEAAVPAPQVVAHDLTTGAEVGRVTLDGVLAGTWPKEGTTADDHLFTEVGPGIALSPDGRRLAIAHADREALTLIDAEQLAIERTVAITGQVGLGGRMLRFLGLMPQEAEAKFSEGTIIEAVFSPDGRRLYLYGYESVLEGTERQRADGLGLRVVDVTTGEVVAEGLHGELIDHVIVAPDGRNAYVAGPEGGYRYLAWVSLPEGEPDSRAYLLRRLDASSLDRLAEREFGRYSWMVIASPGVA